MTKECTHALQGVASAELVLELELRVPLCHNRNRKSLALRRVPRGDIHGSLIEVSWKVGRGVFRLSPTFEFDNAQDFKFLVGSDLVDRDSAPNT